MVMIDVMKINNVSISSNSDNTHDSNNSKKSFSV